jgi:sec-independent protein translocase protein TatA
MLNDLFGGWHILIVLAIVVLLFGATRLPALARALGQSRNAFKSEMKKGEESDGAKDSKSTAVVSEDTSNTTPKP